jgi:hypothetical protein
MGRKSDKDSRLIPPHRMSFHLRLRIVGGIAALVILVGSLTGSPAQETGGVAASTSVAPKPSQPARNQRKNNISSKPNSSHGNVDLDGRYQFDEPATSQSEGLRPARQIRGTGTDHSSGMTSPIVGSEEWQKQEENEERLDRKLNNQIHSICKNC